MRALTVVLMSLVALASTTYATTSSESTPQTYCRSVESDGSFGQPRGTRQHCVTLKAGYLTDDANTFFGNPPETLPYVLQDCEIFVLREGVWESAYTMTSRGLENSAGAVLKRVK